MKKRDKKGGEKSEGEKKESGSVYPYPENPDKFAQDTGHIRLENIETSCREIGIEKKNRQSDTHGRIQKEIEYGKSDIEFLDSTTRLS